MQSPMYTNNETFNDTSEDYELFYRHSTTMTIVYFVAYLIVFIVGLIGNSFVIAVVFRYKIIYLFLCCFIFIHPLHIINSTFDIQNNMN